MHDCLFPHRPWLRHRALPSGPAKLRAQLIIGAQKFLRRLIFAVIQRKLCLVKQQRVGLFQSIIHRFGHRQIAHNLCAVFFARHVQAAHSTEAQKQAVVLVQVGFDVCFAAAHACLERADIARLRIVQFHVKDALHA